MPRDAAVAKARAAVRDSRRARVAAGGPSSTVIGGAGRQLVRVPLEALRTRPAPRASGADDSGAATAPPRADPADAPEQTDRADGSDSASGSDSVRPGARGRWLMAVRERLPLWLQLRCGVEPKTLAALAVVLLVAVGFAVHHFWSGRPEPVRPPQTLDGGSSPAPEPGATAPPGALRSGAAATPARAGAEVTVDVAGKVRRPGIHTLPPGSRVADALKASGGLRPGTDTEGLNRARLLVDGEQIVAGEPPAPAPGGAPAGGSPPGTAPGGTGSAAPGARISLGSATAEQLETLPGVGPVLAQHIIDYRTQHGGFSSVDQLREVNGIGEARFADIEPRVGP